MITDQFNNQSKLLITVDLISISCGISNDSLWERSLLIYAYHYKIRLPNVKSRKFKDSISCIMVITEKQTNLLSFL
jgi:hypothetical protein